MALSHDRRAYDRAYYLKHKPKINRRRSENRRKHQARQRAWLESLGLWPIIPEHRRYEIPPDIRAQVLAREARRVKRQAGQHPE